MSCLKQESSESTDINNNQEELDHDDQSELHVQEASEAEVAELMQEFEAIKKKAERTPLHNAITAYIVQAGETPLLTRAEEVKLSHTMVQQRTNWCRSVLRNPQIQRKIVEDLRQIISGEMFVASYVTIKSPVGETSGRKARIEKRMSELEIHNAISDSMRKRKSYSVLTESKWEEEDEQTQQEAQENIATLLEEIGLEIEPLIVAFNAAKKEPVSKTHTKHELAAFIEKTGASPEEWEHALKIASAPFNEWQQARSHIVKANLRLVISIAKKYRNRGKPFLDLIQDGNLGLMRGVDKFNPDLGNRVSTYVTWWIHQKVGRESSNDRRFMRLPEHMKGLAQKILNFEREYAHEHGGGVLHNETIAEHLSETLEHIAITRAELHGTLSLDYSFARDADSSFSLHSLLADSRELPPEIRAENANVRALIRRVLLTFPERQIEIINERFGLGFEVQRVNGVVTLHNNSEKYGQEMTLNTISSITSGSNQKAVTRERIRQIETKAIDKLLTTEGSNPVRAQLQHIASELMDNVHDTPPSKLNGDSPQPEPISSANPTLDINLTQLSLPLRLNNALEGYGIFTIRDLLSYTNADLLGLNGISIVSIHLLDEALARLGLERFKGETPLKANKVKKTEELPM